MNKIHDCIPISETFMLMEVQSGQHTSTLKDLYGNTAFCFSINSNILIFQLRAMIPDLSEIQFFNHKLENLTALQQVLLFQIFFWIAWCDVSNVVLKGLRIKLLENGFICDINLQNDRKLIPLHSKISKQSKTNENEFLHIPTFQRISQLMFLGANGNSRGSTMGMKTMKVMCTLFGHIVKIYD